MCVRRQVRLPTEPRSRGTMMWDWLILDGKAAGFGGVSQVTPEQMLGSKKPHSIFAKILLVGFEGSPEVG